MTIVGVIASVLTESVSGLNFSSSQIGRAGSIYVAAGLPVVQVGTARGANSGDEDEMRGALAFDRERSFQQDFAFGLQQLSDTTIRHEEFTGRGSNGSV